MTTRLACSKSGWNPSTVQPDEPSIAYTLGRSLSNTPFGNLDPTRSATARWKPWTLGRSRPWRGHSGEVHAEQLPAERLVALFEQQSREPVLRLGVSRPRLSRGAPVEAVMASRLRLTGLVRRDQQDLVPLPLELLSDRRQGDQVR